MRTKAQRQQYLTLEEETALAKFLLLMAHLGHPVRIKYIPSHAIYLQKNKTRKFEGNKERGLLAEL
jgi:hypothetical protein